MTKKEILESAANCVCRSREEAHGSPENNFACIAAMWNAYLYRKSGCINDLNGADVAAMCALLKLSRIAGGNASEDSWVDLAGYAACGGEIDTNNEGMVAA